MFPIDQVRDGLEKVKDVTTETVVQAAGVFEDVTDKVTEVTTDAAQWALKTARNSPLGDALGLNPSAGDDGGSSRWENWSHQAIRDMLDETVRPADVHEGAREWETARTEASEIITGVTGELSGILKGGWGGESGAKALGALGPINAYASELAPEVGRTRGLLTGSGEAADQARAQVEPPVEFDVGQTIRKAVTPVILGGGPLAGGLDVMAQERAQEDAHQEAVRKMYALYSTPINAQREQVPAAYPRLNDPTLQPPEPVPGQSRVEVPGLGGPGAGGPGGSFQPPPSPFSAPPAAGTAPQYAEPTPPAAGAGQGVGGSASGPGAFQPPPGPRYGDGAGPAAPVSTQGMGAGGYGRASSGGAGGDPAGGQRSRGGPRGAGSAGGGYGGGVPGPQGAGGPVGRGGGSGRGMGGG